MIIGAKQICCWSTCAALVTVLAITLLHPSTTYADTLAAWDWNDGTTQGWTASKGQSNEGNALKGVNVGNGSLQFYGPLLPAGTLTGLSTVSFDITILSYSSVMSPGELTNSSVYLGRFPPAIPRSWYLDLSGLAFGETRRINLSLSDAFGSEPLSDPLFFGITLADASYNQNSSAALLDNFIVSGTVPEAPAIGLISVGLICLAGLLTGGSRR
jgi:hypothetical protein